MFPEFMDQYLMDVCQTRPALGLSNDTALPSDLYKVSSLYKFLSVLAVEPDHQLLRVVVAGGRVPFHWSVARPLIQGSRHVEHPAVV
jgi:hypothetical protein